MFKLVFLFVVLAAVVAVITANPHPHGHTQSKKDSALQKQHHGLDSHGRAATRVARNHKAHAPVHHGPGGSAHHSNKIAGGKHAAHAATGNKGAVHRPVKHRGHRK